MANYAIIGAEKWKYTTADLIDGNLFLYRDKKNTATLGYVCQGGYYNFFDGEEIELNMYDPVKIFTGTISLDLKDFN